MSHSQPIIALLLFKLLLFISFTPLPVFSSHFSTFAISQSSNYTVICAVVLSLNSSSVFLHQYQLNCTNIVTGYQSTYSFGNTASFAIAAGNGFLCGLTVPTDNSLNSTMKWWDFDTTSNNSNVSESKRVYWGPPLTALASSESHVCGLIGEEHKPECWRWSNLSITAGLNFSDIAVGHDFVCGLLTSGLITCFGNETEVVGKEPFGNFTMVSGGARHACGVSFAGELTCWGIGAPKTVEVSGQAIADITLGDNTTCVLQSNGTVLCFGDVEQPSPDTEFIAIQAKGNSICGILRNNYSVICWGNAFSGYNAKVFDRVLPGTCSSISSCHCGALPGSGDICPPFDQGICQSCKLQFNTIPSPTTKKTKNTSILLIILGSIGLIIGLLSILSYTIYILNTKKMNPAPAPTRLEPPTSQPAPPTLSRRLPCCSIEQFSLEPLLEATENFSETKKIGAGSFGTVYRATLSDGRVAAVKRAKFSTTTTNQNRNISRQAEHQKRAFCCELSLLSRVNHKNLVHLLGFCRENGEQILVYEYMPNGSLHDHLHKISSSSPLSSWPRRLKIALDAARGVEYLHSYAVPPIIHRDIKSSNILLDSEWTAKVADFGLSMSGDDDDDVSSDVAAGTVGYIDPEYHSLRALTTKSDVYSFGVVLLELITGLKAVTRGDSGEVTGAEYGEPRHVVDVVVPWIESGDVNRVLDRRMASPSPETTAEAVAYVAYVAAECVNGDGQTRPNMGAVVGALERAMEACGPEGIS